MKYEEAARLLDPETSREALLPYAYDPQYQQMLLRNACWLAAEVLRDSAKSSNNGWISVKDGLPEDDKKVQKSSTGDYFEILSVIAYGKLKGGFDFIAKETNRILWHKTGVERLDNATLDAGQEFEKWYWSDCWEEVTHWMYLPGPPKEGEKRA